MSRPVFQRRSATLTLLCALAPGLSSAAPQRLYAAAPTPGAAANFTTEEESGGSHLRVSTGSGPVHLFRPQGYDARTAGIVVYVHGYYVDVDQAWRQHALAAQFSASGRNALFVTPEAPAGADQKPSWRKLQRLLTFTLRRARLDRPRGAVVVVGHSGAFRTIVPWLDERFWHHLILIDGLYGNETDFGQWLKQSTANRMTLVVKGTAKWADPFVRARRYAVTVPQIPDDIGRLSRRERNARLLALRSQYGHLELITDGKVLPVLLHRTPLPAAREMASPPP